MMDSAGVAALIGGLLLTLLVSTGAGCRQSGATDQRAPSVASSPSSSDGSCDFDLRDERADNVFFVLGLLNVRGVVEGSDRVESFYCNEQTVAQLFHRRLTALAKEQNLPADVREETVQQCLTFYYSKVLADRLNSCYKYELTIPRSAPASSGSIRRTGATSFNLGLFYRGRTSSLVPERGLSDGMFFRRRALAYVAGTWARFGRGPDSVLTNYPEKAEFVAGLLSGLGCSNVRVEHTVGLIPGGWLVHFEPTNEVTEWLRKAW